MKESTLTTKIAMLIMFLAVIAYLIVSAVRSFYDPFSTVLSYSYTLDDGVETTGFVVRQEVIIPGSAEILDVVPYEGERVANGATVAYLYQDQKALDRKRELEALTLEMEQLTSALDSDATGWDNATLDLGIQEAAVNLKSTTANGDLTHLEENALYLKSLIIRREFTYDDASIATFLSGIQSDIDTLQSTAHLDTTLVRAPQSGLFSAVTDGFEAVLTPETIANLTPSGYDAMTQSPPNQPSTVGKLITDSSWQFITTLDEADAGQLYEGSKVTVAFSRDWSGQVEMQVIHLSDVQNGKVAVVLSADRSLAEITLLRKQTVSLIFDHITGIRVPKNALRSITTTVTDPDTGAETLEKSLGVYALIGGQAELKPVTVVASDGDYYLLQPANPDSRTALRPGDEIIVAAEELYDGKIISS